MFETVCKKTLFKVSIAMLSHIENLKSRYTERALNFGVKTQYSYIEVVEVARGIIFENNI